LTLWKEQASGKELREVIRVSIRKHDQWVTIKTKEPEREKKDREKEETRTAQPRKNKSRRLSAVGKN